MARIAMPCCSTPPPRCVVAGHVDSLTEGAEEAAETIDRGLANALLDCWIAYS